MTYPQHIRAVLTLGLPLIGSQLALFAIGLVDTIMLGWYGVEPLAASVLATSLFFLLFLMGAGFAFAVMPMAAEAASQDDIVRTRRVTRMGLWLSLMFSICALPLMIWSGLVFRVLGQEPDLADLAQTYLRIAGFGLIPALLVTVLRSFLSALERTQIVLWITVLAVLSNAFVNWLLIFGNLGMPELGIRGAAIASVFTQSQSLVLTIAYILWLKPLRVYALFQRIWRPDWPAFMEVFRLGWPIGLTSLAETAMFAVSAIFVGLIGTIPLAAHGIALQIASGTFMVHVGLSQAATIRAGRALGRKDIEGLGKGAWTAFGLSMVFVALTILVFLMIPETLVSGFIAPDEIARSEIIGIGVTLLAVAALFQLVDAVQVMALGMLRGIQDTRLPMIYATISYWIVGIPASYLIGIQWNYGPVGVWLGLVIGLGLAAVLIWARFVNRFRQMQTEARKTAS